MANQARTNPTIYDALAFITGQATVEDIRTLYAAAKMRMTTLSKDAASSISKGDAVTFVHKKHGALKGRITGRSGKNMLVALVGSTNILVPTNWRISPTLLTKVG